MQKRSFPFGGMELSRLEMKAVSGHVMFNCNSIQCVTDIHCPPPCTCSIEDNNGDWYCGVVTM